MLEDRSAVRNICATYHTCTHVYACAHTDLHTGLCTHAQARAHACMSTHTHTPLQQHDHAHTPYMNVCTHAYAHIRVYIGTHVFAHTCKNSPSASWRYCFSHIRWAEIPKPFGKLSVCMCLVGEDGHWMRGPLGSIKRPSSQWLTLS